MISGDDPRDDCDATPVTSCDRDGTCDGQGACRRYSAGTECQPGGCVDVGHERSARLCDGKGVCQDAGARACAGASCKNDSCATGCTKSADCLAGFICQGGTCQLKRGLGKACMSGTECGSGVCSDGVCCNVVCNGTCVSCNLASKAGTCSPRASGTSCGGGSCTGNVANPAPSCDGKGVCQAAVRTDCLAFACAAGGCPSTCATSANCATGFVCTGGSCVSAGLLVYWRLDEPGAQDAVKDSSGHGVDGIYVGPPAPTQVVPPPVRFSDPFSRSFDAGARTAALIPALPAALKPTGPFTMAIWFRSKGIAPGGEGGELISLANNQLLRILPGGFEVSKRVKKSDDFKYVRCLSAPDRTDHLDGQWHHLAAVVDAKAVRIYFDGARVCELENDDPLGYDLSGSFAVGRHGQTNPAYDFTGELDEVRVYGRALALSEIIALAAGLP